MNALITGGAGFIASHLACKLAEAGCDDLRVIDLVDPWYKSTFPCSYFRMDLSVIGEYPEVLRGIDTVFHLAWASIPESATKDPLRDIKVNLAPTINLLDQCVSHGVKRVIFLSTGGAIYGLSGRLPASENHPTDPVSAYGISKLAAEKYIALYHRLYGLEYSILRPSVPCGEYQNPFGRQGAIAVFLGKILQNKPIVIWGEPSSITRDFFYVGDLANACILAARAKEPTTLYNIGSGVGINLVELVDMLAKVVGPKYPVEIQTSPPRPFDVPSLILDISNAKKFLGWKPTVPLVDAVRRTWNWIRALPLSDQIAN